MSNDQIECLPFIADRFEALVAGLCPGYSASDQVKYLAAYLKSESLSVKTLVIERHYVDRHFIEEYANYYATCFRPPQPHAIRIHVFSEAFSRAELLAWVEQAGGGEQALDRVESRLQEAYRGFIVIRPLPSAPVGRTLLATFSGERARCFETLQRSKVHLLGFELTIDSVPFQQQDGAVGACATTAAWSALTAVARATGHRGPTPFQVTHAATRHILNDRQWPASAGLDQQQLISAIQALGFAPYVLKAANNFAIFSHSLKCYLASGIPVVLLIHARDSGYHALTAVGFRSPDETHVAPDFVLPQNDSWSVVTSGFTRLYVHEDRLGPYARMLWLPPACDGDAPRLQHLPFADVPALQYSYGDEPMDVYSGIVPLYPKLRLTARELLGIAADVMPHLRLWTEPRLRPSLRIDIRFKLGGEYLRELLELEVRDTDALDAVVQFVTNTSLSRFVGVIRFLLGDAALGDVVCDTTDMLRDQKFGAILGCVPFVSSYVDAFEQFTNKYLNRP